MLSFLFASVILAFVFVLAILKAVRMHLPRLSAHLSGRASKIADAADLAGIHLPSKAALALSPISPFALLAMRVMHKRRCREADRQLPDALSLIGGAVKAGLSLSQAIEITSKELTGPLGEEIGRVASKLRLGATTEEALSILSERLDTEDVSLIVQSVKVLKKTGGNLIETFSVLAATVEGRLAVEEKISLLTAQGLYQGILLIAMPWMLGLMLHVIAPEYVEPLYSTRLGICLIGCGVALETLGAFWIRRVVSIRV